jgi:hypothetical protein
MKDLVDYIETTDIQIPRVDLIMLDMQVNELADLLTEHCLNVDSTLWSLLAMLEDVLVEYGDEND